MKLITFPFFLSASAAATGKWIFNSSYLSYTYMCISVICIGSLVFLCIINLSLSPWIFLIHCRQQYSRVSLEHVEKQWTWNLLTSVRQRIRFEPSHWSKKISMCCNIEWSCSSHSEKNGSSPGVAFSRSVQVFSNMSETSNGIMHK